MIHNVGKSFNLDLFLKARELTIKAVHSVKEQVFIGMSEDEGHDLIDKTLDRLGASKKWHPNKFRIGQNTTKSFRERSEPNIKLQENDIYFIDIGPVWDGHEGDYGETFVTGSNNEFELIRNASKDVFTQTARVWKEQGLSGADLYDFAEDYALSLGYKLNKAMKGHRLGDFPHHLFYKGGMVELSDSPCENLWVLEIHLLSLDEDCGAFYEDILRK